jgi:hypothetical protein
MKIVICLWANLAFLALYLQSIFASEIGFGLLKKGKVGTKKLLSREDPAVDPTKSQDLPDIPVYFQGWVKYLHFKDQNSNFQKAFYKNIAYDKQNKKGITGVQLAQKDDV